MAKKLYVGNLPYGATDQTLRDLFAGVGSVSSATIIIDKMSGRSKGFGFVEMENDDDAQKAINDLNGTEYEGRKIVVNEARPLTEKRPFRPRGGGFGGGSRGGGRDFGGRNDY